MKSVPIIYVVICIGSVSALLLALFWKETTVIGGIKHSTALLLLIFCLSLVDCTSSVLYTPYMAFWRDIYLSSYLIGEGLSGLLPALVALGQGVGGNAKCENKTDINLTTGEITWNYQQVELEPNFSIDTFFYILFGMMVASSLSFVLLEFLPMIQSERSDLLDEQIVPKYPNPNIQEYQLVTTDRRSHNMKKRIFICLLSFQAWACLLANGLLPSIQAFSCGPYGDVPYHLAATLSALANPLAAFCTMLIPKMTPRIIGFLTLISTGLGSYIFATAVMSPNPPLVDHLMGAILIVSLKNDVDENIFTSTFSILCSLMHIFVSFTGRNLGVI